MTGHLSATDRRRYGAEGHDQHDDRAASASASTLFRCSDDGDRHRHCGLDRFRLGFPRRMTTQLRGRQPCAAMFKHSGPRRDAPHALPSRTASIEAGFSRPSPRPGHREMRLRPQIRLTQPPQAALLDRRARRRTGRRCSRPRGCARSRDCPGLDLTASPAFEQEEVFQRARLEHISEEAIGEEHSSNRSRSGIGRMLSLSGVLASRRRTLAFAVTLQPLSCAGHVGNHSASSVQFSLIQLFRAPRGRTYSHAAPSLTHYGSVATSTAGGQALGFPMLTRAAGTDISVYTRAPPRRPGEGSLPPQLELGWFPSV